MKALATSPRRPHVTPATVIRRPAINGHGGNTFEARNAGNHRIMAALTQLAKDAQGCQRCDLYRNATQTVFGAGARTAPLMLVGEQPGDQEDKAGKPFVGPGRPTTG